MKISCEIIKDLLPLYNDGVCSNESAELISEHLKECSECTAELERLREEIPLSLLKSEEKEIIGAYRRKVLKNALLFGLCFIVFPLINVFYAGHFYEAGFFKPFLATVLVMLDMVFLPAVIKNDRKAILTVCSVSVPIAMFWVLDLDHFHPETLMIDVIVFLIHFTFSAVCISLKLKADHESPMRFKRSALRLGAAETIVLIAASILEGVNSEGNAPFALEGIGFKLFIYVLPFLVFLWTVCLLARLLKANSYIGASLYTICTGLFLSLFPAAGYFADKAYYVSNYGENFRYAFWQADLLNSGSDHFIANISLVILIIFTAISVVLFVKGRQRSLDKRKEVK